MARLSKATDKFSGAAFSEDDTRRYALWRIWDETKPLAMFVGLNPSNATWNEDTPTIRSVRRITKALGFGGFYMMNCFTFITPHPEKLDTKNNDEGEDWTLEKVADECKEVVFCWGRFRQASARGKELAKRFPKAKCLGFNNDGTPKHPLFLARDMKLIPFN